MRNFLVKPFTTILIGVRLEIIGNSVTMYAVIRAQMFQMTDTEDPLVC